MKKATILFLLFAFLLSNSLMAKNFKGAEYRTKEAYTYGRFEVRYKSAQREGMLASFFTYYDGGGGTSKWNEIDLEIMGRYNNEAQFNTITPGQTNHVRAQPVNFNPGEDYHTYAFEWTPQYVAWFIDGEEVYRQTGAHIQTLTLPQKIMMNVWPPAYVDWAGVLDVNSLPAFSYYDFVSYYSFTPDSGNYGTNNNFTNVWTDNFDSWDQSRWEKATHTFDGNNCDFMVENAVFKDGNLILCLTDKTNLGYTDKLPPSLVSARASVNKVVVNFSEELDKASSENKANYLIPNVTVDSASLLPDQKSVMLYLTNFDLSKTYNVIAQKIKDRAIPQNISSLKAVTINMPKPVVFPIKIDVGGLANGDYLADQPWKESAEYGYMDGSITQYPSTLQINGTDEDAIYRSERFGLVGYKVRVPNGTYRLKLMMAENFFSQNESRVFDVYVEGKVEVKDLDLFKIAGINTAYELTIQNVSVTDEILEINLAAQINRTLLNGIIIEDASTGILNESKEFPSSFILGQNFPNPFNGTTKIQFYLQREEHLSLFIHDILGKQIFFRDLGIVKPGKNEFIWNAIDGAGKHLSSNVYFYSLKGKDFLQSKKLILLN
ncbi:MAG: family 16 glycosylhydrolase [Ignavibacteriales bacterium]|nr:family 16 glycosylhydrolase [Ignavibacteriales bacterium]